jgi:hypothetical protein
MALLPVSIAAELLREAAGPHGRVNLAQKLTEVHEFSRIRELLSC